MLLDPWHLEPHAAPRLVHPPHERKHDVRATVEKDHLQCRNLLEHAATDEAGQVNHRGGPGQQRVVLDVVVAVASHGRELIDPRPTVSDDGHREAEFGGLLPHRQIAPRAVRFAALQRDCDGDELRIAGDSLELGDRSGRVLGIDTHRTCYAVAQLRVVKPFGAKPFIGRPSHCGPEVGLGNQAARQRDEDRAIGSDLGVPRLGE